MSAARRGFSMVELMVVVVLGALIIFALQQALVVQRRYWSAQGGVTQRHEVARVAMAVLTGALREANLATGDVVVLTPGRIQARMPLGLGLVCGTDLAGQRVGVVAAEGWWAAGAGDSMLVQRAGGWTAEAVTALGGGPDPLVPCVPAGGTVASVARPVLDVVKGSAVRPFRSLIFEVALDAGAPWLFRADGALTEPLAGPLDGASGFRAWYEDATGVEVATPALAIRVGVRVITAAGTGVGASNRQDTLILTFGGRNR